MTAGQTSLEIGDDDFGVLLAVIRIKKESTVEYPLWYYLTTVRYCGSILYYRHI